MHQHGKEIPCPHESAIKERASPGKVMNSTSADATSTQAVLPVSTAAAAVGGMRDGEIGRQPQKHRRGLCDLPRDASPYCSHTIPSSQPGAPGNWAFAGGILHPCSMRDQRIAEMLPIFWRLSRTSDSGAFNAYCVGCLQVRRSPMSAVQSISRVSAPQPDAWIQQIPKDITEDVCRTFPKVS